MSEFAARISRVRMKDGASVTILPTPMDYGDPDLPENWRGKLIEHAKRIAGYDEPKSELDGFLVIGMFSDGSTSIGLRIPDRLPRPLIPGYVAEILRRDVITECAAERVFDAHFEWVEQ
jgi:hypothetical protein